MRTTFSILPHPTSHPLFLVQVVIASQTDDHYVQPLACFLVGLCLANSSLGLSPLADSPPFQDDVLKITARFTAGASMDVIFRGVGVLSKHTQVHPYVSETYRFRWRWILLNARPMRLRRSRLYILPSFKRCGPGSVISRLDMAEACRPLPYYKSRAIVPVLHPVSL